MFYVQRDQYNALVRVEAQAFAESTGTLPADHQDIQAWFATDVIDNSLLQGSNDTNLTSYLKLSTDSAGNSTLSVSSSGSFTAQGGGTADVTIKVDGASWGSGSAAINSLIAGGDLTVKHHD